MLKRVFWIILLPVCQWGYAEQPGPAVCYLPTEQNVAYTQVTDLPTGSPAEIIAYGPDPLQFGELWLPTEGLPPQLGEASRARNPLLILIHGGCWLNQYDIGHTHALSTALTYAGYAVWSIEYRRTGDPGGGWPGSYNDVKQAIRFVTELQAYPVETSKPVLIGHSAGGHLALLAAKELAGQKSVAEGMAMDFSAVIGLAAIVDIEEYARGGNSCQIATPEFIGGLPSERPDDYVAASPARHGLHRNTVLIHGDQDTIVPIDQAMAYEKNVRMVKGAGHFDMIHPATPAHQQLLKELAIAFSDRPLEPIDTGQ